MNYNNSKAYTQIIEHVTSKYNKIKVKAGKCRYNFYCHANAVHEAKKHKHKKLAMCVYIDDGYPIVHFVNYNKGKFIDNTLGEWSQQHDYYFIKWVKEDEMWDIFNIHTSFKKELRKTLSWWVKLTSNYGG